MTDDADDNTKAQAETQTLRPGALKDQGERVVEDRDDAIEALEEVSDMLSEAGTHLGDSDYSTSATMINEAITVIGRVLDFIEEQVNNDSTD